MGCAALTCSRAACRCRFCAFCLEDCGDDAHAHVKACPNRPKTMTDNYFDTRAEFEEVQRLRRQRMVDEFIGQQEKAVRPLLLEALRGDLEDLKIVIELKGANPSSSGSADTTVDELVIQLILQHCPSVTRVQALDAMKTQNNDFGKAINMLHQQCIRYNVT